MDGEETVQLYIRDLVASTSRPILELKGFKKIAFEAGETKKVEFHLSKDQLSFYNSSGDLIFEPGEFDISVGTSSAELQTQRIELN